MKGPGYCPSHHQHASLTLDWQKSFFQFSGNTLLIMKNSMTTINKISKENMVGGNIKHWEVSCNMLQHFSGIINSLFLMLPTLQQSHKCILLWWERQASKEVSKPTLMILTSSILIPLKCVLCILNFALVLNVRKYTDSIFLKKIPFSIRTHSQTSNK